MADLNLDRPHAARWGGENIWRRAGLVASAIFFAMSWGLSSLATAQVGVEYGTMGGRQAATVTGAAGAVAPAMAAPLGAPPAAPAKRRGLGDGGPSRADGPICSGEMTAPTSVSVSVGKSSLLRLPEPVTKRTVGNPDVVDTRLVSPQVLYVLGVETGSTNMILQGKSGRCIVVDVDVGFDGGSLTAKIRELFPDEGAVKVSSAADSLVLSGTVTDAMRASQVVQLANAYVRTGSGGSGGSGAPGGQAAVSPRVVNMMAIAAPQQVMLEVKIAEISKKLLEKIGAEVNRSTTNGNWTYFFGSSFLSAGAATIGGFKNLLNNFTIDAENSEELLKILAEPTVMAISGQEGSFLAGGRIFIPVAQNGTAGGASTITLEEKEFGVGLRFTPTVLNGDRINLRVAPEVSEVNPEGVPITLNGSTTSVLPSITTRRASTTVQLRDGETFAIGGLINNNVRHKLAGYPGLGEIPILGALFRSNSFQNDRTELLFVVTPRLVKPLPPNYALPTDAYVAPGRGGRLGMAEMEGSPSAPAASASAPAPAASASSQAKPAGGFEVK